MAFSVNGLMSGLDTSSILNQMMQLERRPMQLLQLKVEDYNAKISAFGVLTGSLADLQSAVKGLQDAELYSTFLASTASDLVTVAAGDDAVAGRYQVTVDALAQAQSVKSASFAASDAVVGTGTLTVQVGSNPAVDVTIDATNNTLAGIAQAINAANADVSAGVVNDGLGSYFLTLSGKETGAANTISLTMNDADGVNDDAAGLSSLYADPATQALSQTQPAANAQLSVNGIAVEREGNTIDDLIQGVTVTLNGEDPGNPFVITVARDTASVKSKIGAFVSKYNTVVDTLGKLQAYDPERGVAALLQGDSLTRNLQEKLRGLLQRQVAGVSDSVNQLSELGIEVGRDGRLSFDSTVFDAAYESNREDVANFFTLDDGEEEGFAVRFDNMLESYLSSSTGILAAKENGLKSSIDRLEDQILRMESRLSKREENLQKQFEGLESLLAQFQNTTGVLNQQLDALSNLSAQIYKK